MTKIIKIIATIGTIVLVAIIFYAIFQSFSWQEAYTLIRTLRWTTVIIFIACILAISLIKATRFFVILRSGDVEVSFIKTLLIFIPSQAFTPLPGGEIGRALLFQNKLHLKMKSIAAPVYLQAVIELWTAVCLAIVSIFFIKIRFGIWLLLGLFLTLIVLTVSILIPKKLHSVLFFLKNNGLKYAWVDSLGKMLDSSEQFIITKHGNLHWRLWASSIALGAASHGVAGFLMWYIALVQGVNISFFQSIFAATIAVLIQSIFGVIPGGLGVTEGGLLGILSSYGMRWNKAVIITLLYRLLMLPLLVMIALLFLLIIYIPNIFGNKKNKAYT